MIKNWPLKFFSALVFSGSILAGLLMLLATSLVQPISHCGDFRRTKATADIRAISEALGLFETEFGRTPTAEEGLAILVSGENAGRFVDKMPRDPWGNLYVYEPSDDSYSVSSLGADGKPGGEGADADIHSPGEPA